MNSKEENKVIKTNPKRFLGYCCKCKDPLTEIWDIFWCYNHQFKEKNHPDAEKLQIVFIGMDKNNEPKYKCRSCATQKEKKHHDRHN